MGTIKRAYVPHGGTIGCENDRVVAWQCILLHLPQCIVEGHAVAAHLHTQLAWCARYQLHVNKYCSIFRDFGWKTVPHGTTV